MYWFALRHGRVHESNTNVTEQNVEILHQRHDQQNSLCLQRFRTASTTDRARTCLGSFLL